MSSQFNQRGQGMAEFAVVASFFLVPLLIGMTWLARVESARQHLYQAARYAAWERTVWYRSGNDYVTKSDADVSREITQRIFAPADKTIDTANDRKVANGDTEKIDPFLYTSDYKTGNTLRMFKVTGNQQALTGVTYSSAPLSNAISRAIDAVVKMGLRLDDSGIATSTVSVELEKIPLLADLLPVQFTSQAHNALLGGAWNANGPTSVVNHIKPLVSTDYVNKIPGFNVLQNLLGVFFPEIAPGYLDLGHVDPNKVPCQRVGAFSGGKNSGTNTPDC